MQHNKQVPELRTFSHYISYASYTFN